MVLFNFFLLLTIKAIIAPATKMNNPIINSLNEDVAVAEAYSPFLVKVMILGYYLKLFRTLQMN